MSSAPTAALSLLLEYTDSSSRPVPEHVRAAAGPLSSFCPSTLSLAQLTGAQRVMDCGPHTIQYLQTAISEWTADRKQHASTSAVGWSRLWACLQLLPLVVPVSDAGYSALLTRVDACERALYRMISTSASASPTSASASASSAGSAPTDALQWVWARSMWSLVQLTANAAAGNSSAASSAVTVSRWQELWTRVCVAVQVSAAATETADAAPVTASVSIRYTHPALLLVMCRFYELSKLLRS